MRTSLARLLRWLGFVHFDVLSHPVSTFPAEAILASAPDMIFHVVDGGVEKWACMKCPGGCGVVIPLSLNPKRRPRWSIGTDWLRRPSVSPSVHQQNECGCHFWIRKGRIDWCEGGRPRSTGT